MAQTKLEIIITDDDTGIDFEINTVEPVSKSQFARHLQALEDAFAGRGNVSVKEVTTTPVSSH